ncbi:MAG: ATP-binding protein [Mycoplasmoidaceae bacterium]
MENKTNKLDLNIQNILEDWEIWHAIREIIANAIDEHKIRKISNIPIINFNDNIIEIIDQGNGIKKEHFIQNENKEKTERNDLIGKFGIGLKDAIATFNRKNIKLRILSNNFEYSPIMMQKFGAEEGTKTIHIECLENKDLTIGTRFIIQNINYYDLEKAKNQFLIFSNKEFIFENEYGEIYKKLENEKSSIYINGMKISEDEEFLYSYNITKKSRKIDNGMNRERNNLGRDIYRESIINILKRSNNEIFKKILEKKSGEYQFIDVKYEIFKRFNMIIITEDFMKKEPRCVQYITSAGKEFISVLKSEYDQLRKKGIKDAESFLDNYLDNYESKTINLEQLESEEKDIFDNGIRLIKFFKLNKNDYEIKLIEDHPNAYGITNNEKKIIEITKKTLGNKRKFYGTLLHELAHSYNGYSDCTKEFENDLTDLLGEIFLLLENKSLR